MYFSEIQQGGGGGRTDESLDGGEGSPAMVVADDRPGEKAAEVAGQRRLPFPPPSNCCGPAEFKGDFRLPPHPAEYPATVVAFDEYLDDCKGFPEAEVIDDLAEWLTKYNHCHGPDGRFCGGHGHGASGTFTPLSARPGGGGGTGEAARDFGNAGDGDLGHQYREMSKGWHASLGTHETAAIETYSSNKFTDVNRYLRQGTALQMSDQEAEGVVKGVDRALASASLKESMIVYRGVSDIKDLGLSMDNLNGAVMHEAAFLSTSLSPKAASDFVGKSGAILKITARKGAKGASMAGLMKYPDEHEVVFARGQSLHVTGHSRSQDGHLIIEATLHPGGKAVRPMASKSLSPRSRREARFGWHAGDVTVIPGPSKGWSY